jgi:predicted 3-demethylubiquinone-9 3-methyltransferase (glyoxalase superfamily)
MSSFAFDVIAENKNFLTRCRSELTPFDSLMHKGTQRRQPIMATTQKITPCLWFNFNAEEAVNYYLSIFKNSRILEISHYGEAMPQHKGKVLILLFEIEGQQFQALNGGAEFPFTEAISLSVDCETQEEVDELWSKLSAGGSEGQCGWLKDKFGLSWQIVPRTLTEMLKDKDADKAMRVMQAMFTMSKIDIARLQQAYNQKEGD